MNLTDYCVAITGGSEGFGLAMGQALIDSGARVALISRSEAKLSAAREALASDRVITIAADVGREAEIAAALAETVTSFGGLDAVVNNAGIARPQKIESLDYDEVVQQIKTNYLGTLFCCKAAIPLLRQSDNPRIVNISSASAFHQDEMSHLSVYASLKAGIERFTRDLVNEVAGDGIGVTCIRPGAGDTRFASEWESQALLDALKAWSESGKWMRIGMAAADVGRAVAFALSQPRGVAVDLLEIRPNQQTEKLNLG